MKVILEGESKPGISEKKHSDQPVCFTLPGLNRTSFFKENFQSTGPCERRSECSEAMLSCAGCEQPIKERYLDKVLDLTWHTYCVLCADCRSELKDKCFSRDGKLFCRRDFFR